MDTFPSTWQVTASNYKCSGSSRVKVYVEDVNDNSPVFEKNDYIVELEEVNVFSFFPFTHFGVPKW